MIKGIDMITKRTRWNIRELEKGSKIENRQSDLE